MSLWSRLANVFRGDRLSREIDEELESHIEEAIEQGRDPVEVRKAFGSLLRQRENSRDIRLLTLFAATLLAALPAVIRAVRIDPVEILRAE